MSDIKYNISQLFKLAFGVNSPVYITGPRQSDNVNFSYDGLQTLPNYLESDWNDTPKTSWMGTPIVFPVTLKNNQSRRKYRLDGSVEQVQLKDCLMPAATMFSFRRAKNITRTNVLGSNGTVKEIFGFDDWVIDVKGVCLDEPSRSAKSQLDELLAFWDLASSVGVSGALFFAAGINAVAINDFSFDVMAASNGGVISFQMQFISDEAIELIL